MSQALGSVLSREKLEGLLHVLSCSLDLPVRLLDEQGADICLIGKEFSYCALLHKQVFHHGECEAARRKAGQTAQKLGESYIFSCDANLTSIVYPLLYRGELLGSVLAGPFLMDEPDSTLLSDLCDHYKLSSSMILSLYDELKGFRILPPSQVSQISRLMDAVLAPLLPGERMLLLERQQKLYQQSRINETVQAFKEGATAQGNGYPFEKEQELILKVKTANLPASKAILNDLLGYVLFSEGGNVDAVKRRGAELCTLLSRVAIENAGESGNLYSLNLAYISRLNALDSYEDICFQLQEIVESFISAISERFAQNGNAAVNKALAYIGSHYAENVTLQTMAEVTGLTPAYFSTLFARVVGRGFREQLNLVRVEEAKRLLTATSYPLAEIAVSVGYADQSYFSKVFKRLTGLSPNHYR